MYAIYLVIAKVVMSSSFSPSKCEKIPLRVLPNIRVGLAIAKARRLRTFVVGSSKSTPTKNDIYLIETSGYLHLYQVLFKMSAHATFGPREDRVQVSHVLDSDSDYTDIPDSKRQELFHTDSELGDYFFGGK